jgi:hypothetical protein
VIAGTGVSTNCHPDTAQPTVFVYDGYPGGWFRRHGFRVAALADGHPHLISNAPATTAAGVRAS